MAGKSGKTTVVAVRLPKEIVEKINKRILVTGSYRTVSGYLRERIIYDITRKHKKHRK